MEPLPDLPQSTAGVDDLVEALMFSAGHINLLLTHMVRSQREWGGGDDADPPMIVLRRLLRGTLAPLADRFALNDILIATRVVNRATAIAESELVMVTPESLAEMERLEEFGEDEPE